MVSIPARTLKTWQGTEKVEVSIQSLNAHSWTSSGVPPAYVFSIESSDAAYQLVGDPVPLQTNQETAGKNQNSIVFWLSSKDEAWWKDQKFSVKVEATDSSNNQAQSTFPVIFCQNEDYSTLSDLAQLATLNFPREEVVPQAWILTDVEECKFSSIALDVCLTVGGCGTIKVDETYCSL